MLGDSVGKGVEYHDNELLFFWAQYQIKCLSPKSVFIDVSFPRKGSLHRVVKQEQVLELGENGCHAFTSILEKSVSTQQNYAFLQN